MDTERVIPASRDFRAKKRMICRQRTRLPVYCPPVILFFPRKSLGNLPAALALALLLPASTAGPLGRPETADFLSALTLDPAGAWVRATDRFAVSEQCNFYAEGDDSFNVLGSAPYLYDVSDASRPPQVPPLGLRSAVPLGGLGTGSVELRADGRFHDWLIENGGPGLSEHGKIALKEELLLGLRVDGVAKVLSPQPPSGMPGVAGLRYAGAFPVSRLEVDHQAAWPVEATLYAYSAFEPWDPHASAVPAITFSVVIHNPSAKPVNVSFAMLTPLLQEKDQTRIPMLSGVVVAISSPPSVASPASASKRRQGWITIATMHMLPTSTDELTGCSISIPSGWGTSDSRAWSADIVDAHHEPAAGNVNIKLVWQGETEPQAVANQSTLLVQCLPRSEMQDHARWTTGLGNGRGLRMMRGLDPKRCRAACDAEPRCWSWSLEPDLECAREADCGKGGGDGSLCVLLEGVEPERRRNGSVAGVKGHYETFSTQAWGLGPHVGASGLRVVRAGEFASSGDFAWVGVCDSASAVHNSASESGAKAAPRPHGMCVPTSSCGVADSLSSLWSGFEDQGSFDATCHVGEDEHRLEGGFGALAVSTEVLAGETVRLGIVFAWHLPFRLHAGEMVGNAYAARFEDARHVARHAILTETRMLHGVLQWNDAIYSSGLPRAMRHMLANSVATFVKTGIWTADGRWRQFESFSCNDMEPVHLHGYRSILLTYLFPQLVHNLLDTGFAVTQQVCASGYVPETLGEGCGGDPGPLDRPQNGCGSRIMGDSSPIFVLSLLQLYQVTGNDAVLTSFLDAIKAAVLWQSQRAALMGLPTNLWSTYDWWGGVLDSENVSTAYNSLLHLAMLTAAERIGDLVGDDELVAVSRQGAVRARVAIDKRLFTGSFLRAFTSADEGARVINALHVDTLYGQLWALRLGLGLLLQPEILVHHLKSEASLASSDFGLLVMTNFSGDDRRKVGRDNMIWEAGSLTWSALALELLDLPVSSSLQPAMSVVNKYLHGYVVFPPFITSCEMLALKRTMCMHTGCKTPGIGEIYPQDLGHLEATFVPRPSSM